jgi:hypothetical protein
VAGQTVPTAQPNIKTVPPDKRIKSGGSAKAGQTAVVKRRHLNEKWIVKAPPKSNSRSRPDGKNAKGL